MTNLAEVNLSSNVTESHGHIKIEGAGASITLKWDRTEDGEILLDALYRSVPDYLELLLSERNPGDVIQGGSSSIVVMDRTEGWDGK